MPELPESISLNDPTALRAYAHPLRMALVALLRREGPLTATQAAERLGESVPNCSFHLRQLAKYGLAERAEGADARERPWQATAQFTSWSNASDDPEVREASNALTRTVMNGYFDQANQWLSRSHEDPAQWRELTGTGDYVLYLTPDEMAQINQRLDDVLSEFAGRTEGQRPEGARGVTYFYIAMTNEGPTP